MNTMQDLLGDYEALDQLGAVVDRVQRYSKLLSIKEANGLTDEEKIWLLAYKGLNLEFKGGTEESLKKASQLTILLDSVVPTDFR